MDEKFLHHIWDGSHLNLELTTVSGKRLRISYSGQYNTNRGPDFLGSGMVMDSQALRGDVEIHQQTSDWHAHNHSEDPYYNNVILHVVYKHNTSRDLTIKENGDRIEILELQHQLSEDIGKLLQEHQPRLPLSRPMYCDLLSALDKDRLQMTLKNIGMQRLQGKVRRFNASLMFSDFDQIMYEGILEAMGYDKNKTAMLSLAQALPLSLLLEWRRDGLQAVEILSILSMASGLLKRSSKLIPPEMFQILQSSWEHQNKYATSLDIDWQLFRIRPANHPIYRLIASLPMVLRYGEDGLMASLLSQLHPRLPQKAIEKSFLEMFVNTTLPGAEALPRPGKGVLNNIYINICLPIFYLWAQKTSDQDLLSQVSTAFQNYGGLAENHLTRSMGSHIDPSYQKLINSHAIYQQALIELHQRYCQFHYCDECRKLRTL